MTYKGKLNYVLNLLCLVLSLSIFFISCSQTAKEEQVAAPPPATRLDFTLAGRVTDYSGRPISRLRVRIETSHQRAELATDRNGMYSLYISQEINESTRFTFVTAIGDTVYFQRSFIGEDPTRQDFVMDDRGVVRPVD